MARKRSSTLRNSAAFRYARRVVRPARRILSGKGAASAGVLMYHRVASEPHDPWNLCVNPDRFAEQMEVIARFDARIDLAALARADGYDRQGRRLAVTFDDGYIDNIIRALPVMEQFEIPATFFVVAGALGRNREFWWDGLERAILWAGSLPDTLAIDLSGRVFEFELKEEDDFFPEWRADQHDAQTSRQKLFLALWAEIVKLAPDEQDDAVDRLLVWAKKPIDAALDRVAASAEDIARLADHPLIRIGSHTVNHASLPDLPAGTQCDEIERGHGILEELLGRRIDRFCYPYGRYNDSARQIVKGLNVDFACTSREGVVTNRSDRLALPRMQVCNLDGECFTRWLQSEHGLIAGRASVH
jgi:peptidoglycan/xylan/chitin deacetylase (PgdA/CDA1 family)